MAGLRGRDEVAAHEIMARMWSEIQLLRGEDLALVKDLRAIATRLAGAPAHTEGLAKADLDGRRALQPGAYRDANHYPHQVGGLEQTCRGTARDIEAIIRRLGVGS